MAAFCEQCGSTLPPDARFCEMCGHPVQEAVDSTPVLVEEEPASDAAEEAGRGDAPDAFVEANDVWTSSNSAPSDDVPNAPSRLRWLAPGAALIFLIVVVAFWLNQDGRDEEAFTSFWQGTLVMADDFSDPRSGWEVWTDEQSSARYEDGQLHLTQRTSGRMSVSRASESFENLALDVEVLPQTLPPGSSYGLLVAFDGDDTYAQLAISEQGAYRILRSREGALELVANWAPLPALLNQETTRLGALRDGRSLVFSINGRPLPEAVADLPPGDIALFVAKSGSGSTEEAHVTFDNVKVWIP